MRISMLALGALVLVALTPSCKKPNPAGESAAPPVAAVHDEAAWQDLSPPDGGFSVRMLKVARAMKETAQSPIGPLETLSWSGQEEAKMYFVSMTKYPTALPDIEGALDGARIGAAKNISGRVLQEKKIKVGDQSGRDVIFSAESHGKPVSVRARLVITGPRLYMLQVVAPEAATTADDPDATRFFDSFKLKPG